jgi:hypothetical protein
MKLSNFKIIGITKLSLLLLLTVAMTACAGVPRAGSTMSWKEEVLLHDGNKIISHRFYNIGGGYDHLAGMVLDETVTFNLPNGKSIIWKNDFRDSVPEPNSLNHFRFDIVNDVPYLATYPAGCIAYNKWGRPNPPQVLFKYTNDQWQRITLADLPPALINAQANVIVGRPDSSLLKPFYNVEAVNVKNAPIRLLEYKTILRDAVKNGEGVTSCEELERYKCGWGAPGEFNREYFERACK